MQPEGRADIDLAGGFAGVLCCYDHAIEAFLVQAGGLRQHAMDGTYAAVE